MWQTTTSSMVDKKKIQRRRTDVVSNHDLVSSIESLKRATLDSVLYRYWKLACCISWTFFITFEVSMFFDRHYSTSPLCPYSDVDYGYWYSFYFYAIAGGFFLTWLSLALKIIFQGQERKMPHVPMYLVFNVLSMSTLSTILALTGQMGICVDALGGAYPAAVWGEWMTCGPLLVFITLTVVDKQELSFLDWFFIGTVFLCLLFAFFMIFKQPFGLAVFWLIMSCVAYAPGIFLPIYMERDRLAALSRLSEREKALYQEKFTKRTILANLLTLIFALVVLNYFIAIAGGYNHAVTIIVAQVLSVLLKGPFSAMTMDVHIDSLFDAQQALLEEQHQQVLLEEQLLHESKTNEARRGFMKYIFHEVRTPLNSLTMGIDLLVSSETLSEQDREYVYMMRASSQFMADTLDDVLSMQKIEEGKFELSLAPFSIRTVIARVFDTFRGSALKKNISFFCHVTQETPDVVVGDVHRVEHVIANFLSNAIKFTPDNKCVAIHANCESFHTNADGKQIVSIKVAVQDEGIGISPEHQKCLFQHYMQIKPSVNQNGGGSGLGLALVKNVVNMHGGTVGVSAKEGEGSTFFFVIPFEVGQAKCDSTLAPCATPQKNDSISHMVFNSKNLQKVAPYPANVTHTQHMRSRSSSDSPVSREVALKNLVPYTQTYLPIENAVGFSLLKKESEDPRCRTAECVLPSSDKAITVLVVDDAESNVKMMTMLLKRLDVTYDTAFNGVEAVQIVGADLHKFDVVLMDNIMPGMTGVQAAAAMRQRGYPYLIIGVTGNVLEEDVKEYIDAGANFVLSKPLRQVMLERLIALVKENGNAPKCGMRIVFDGDRLYWAAM